jgi:hypothetical protein
MMNRKLQKLFLARVEVIYTPTHINGTLFIPQQRYNGISHANQAA